jgi:hypothetical protein
MDKKTKRHWLDGVGSRPLAELLQKYDVNDFAASVKVFAVKAG